MKDKTITRPRRFWRSGLHGLNYYNRFRWDYVVDSAIYQRIAEADPGAAKLDTLDDLVAITFTPEQAKRIAELERNNRKK